MNEQTDLEKQLLAWLKERNATIQAMAVGPKGGAVTVDNFMSASGTNIPPGWTLTLTVVEVKA